MKQWGQPAKGRNKGGLVVGAEEGATELPGNGSNFDGSAGVSYDALLLAEETARQTEEVLATRGWCLWRCSILGGEVIAVVRDKNVKGMPERYPVYHKAEIEELFGKGKSVSKATLRLINEAKKRGSAVLKCYKPKGGGQWKG
jgi:hypothetical protein